MMNDRFDEIMGQVMVENDMEWYEVFDSDKFDEVENRIKAEFGDEVVNTKEYTDWVNEMYWDL